MKTLSKLIFALLTITTNISPGITNDYNNNANPDGAINIPGNYDKNLTYNELMELVFENDPSGLEQFNKLAEDNNMSAIDLTKMYTEEPIKFIELLESSGNNYKDFCLNNIEKSFKNLISYLSFSWLIESFVRSTNKNDEYIKMLYDKYNGNDYHVISNILDDTNEIKAKSLIDYCAERNMTIELENNKINISNVVKELIDKYISGDSMEAANNYCDVLNYFASELQLAFDNTKEKLKLMPNIKKSDKERLKNYLLTSNFNNQYNYKEVIKHIDKKIKYANCALQMGQNVIQKVQDYCNNEQFGNDNTVDEYCNKFKDLITNIQKNNTKYCTLIKAFCNVLKIDEQTLSDPALSGF